MNLFLKKYGKMLDNITQGNEVFQTLRFEQVQENDTRKTSNKVFQTLRFEKNTGKKYSGKRAMFHFKRCGLKKYCKRKCFYYVIYAENK